MLLALAVALAALSLPATVADLLWRRAPVAWLLLPYLSAVIAGMGIYQILAALAMFSFSLAAWRLGGMGFGDAIAAPWLFIPGKIEASAAAFALAAALGLLLIRRRSHPAVAYFGIAYAVGMLAGAVGIRQTVLSWD